MEHIVIFLAIVVTLTVVINLLSREEKAAVGYCGNCPEHRYCGGGRPRCIRRAERSQK